MLLLPRASLRAAALLLASLGGCTESPRVVEPIDLDASHAAFVEAFNAAADKPRLLVILPPTCPYCIEGARVVQQHLVERYPDADLLLQFVWVSAFPDDAPASARAIAQTVGDARALHYWDPQGRVGADVSAAMRFVAPSVWDVYMFYDPGARWGEQAPEPAAWAHQMVEIVSPQYRSPEDLPAYLEERMTAWGFLPARGRAVSERGGSTPAGGASPPDGG